MLLTWVIKNLVIRSDNRLRSLDNIISNISPLSFSMTTKIRSVVSNIQSRFTTPGCSNFPRMATSFFKAASCLVGNLSLSITLIATVLPDFLCLPVISQ